MPKSRERKTNEVAQLKKKLAKSKAVVFTSQRAISVRDIESLRQSLREQQGEFQAIKKTLLARAFADEGIAADMVSYEGTIGLAFSYGDEVAAAKIVSAFAKQHGGMVILGGVLEGAVIALDKVQQLASIPGKQELLTQIVWQFRSPISGMVNVLTGTMRSFVTVLNAIKNRGTTEV